MLAMFGRAMATLAADDLAAGSALSRPRGFR
jgi:hypothetical protein